MNTQHASARTPQLIVAGAVALIGIALAVGAIKIPSEAGYGGIGPNFLPWVVSIVLLACGALMVREALTGGFREMDEPSGAERGWWPGMVWISAGMFANAALITTIGFILSCTLCYLLAVQGLRRAVGEQNVSSPRTLLVDLVTGFAISAPVFWMFTQFLAINLPGITSSGWI